MLPRLSTEPRRDVGFCRRIAIWDLRMAESSAARISFDLRSLDANFMEVDLRFSERRNILDRP